MPNTGICGLIWQIQIIRLDSVFHKFCLSTKAFIISHWSCYNNLKWYARTYNVLTLQGLATMAWCKTEESPLLIHRIYCSFSISTIILTTSSVFLQTPSDFCWAMSACLSSNSYTISIMICIWSCCALFCCGYDYQFMEASPDAI